MHYNCCCYIGGCYVYWLTIELLFVVRGDIFPLYLIGKQKYVIGFMKISNQVQCDSINSNNTSHTTRFHQVGYPLMSCDLIHKHHFDVT